ncbi:Histone acetyltransferase type B subunit 2 [Lecanosticta acicola]|uniref:Histone acetyltransferase type B subunit 2 n=1 Tax=Lecanosticta acicola TaxID=111012 RepID=A0AAI9E7U3_9PEZI|nr:Histone acetyltransferase type B subunit 2 [Lecanosticta acicola]
MVDRPPSRELRALQPVEVSGHTVFNIDHPSSKRRSRLRTSVQLQNSSTAAEESDSAAPAIANAGTPHPQSPSCETTAAMPEVEQAVAERKSYLHSSSAEMTGQTPEDKEIIQNKLINEEYKIWKKNSVFLYDIMYSRALEWPTLTTQWLPQVQDVPGTNMRQHKMIIGTHTSGSAADYLQLCAINLPKPPAMTAADYNPHSEELGGHGATKEPITFSVIQKITHPGEVNKARYQPQCVNIIATWSPNKNVYVWDRSKLPSVPTGEIKPQATLKGHEKEGFALEWNPQVEGQLISGGEDTTVRLWDIVGSFTQDNSVISPARTFTHHSAVVNDVQFHPIHGRNLFGSVSDDKTMCLVDLRSKVDNRAAIQFDSAHADAINSLSFHPKHDKLFAAGSADKTIGIFDLRFPSHGKIHSLEGHKDIITKVDWHPTDSAILASASNDRRIIFWDLSKTGAEQTPEDAEDGPPEMLFMHGGHTNRLSDFSWNKNDPWVICSTGEDNLIQCWRASRHLVELPPSFVQKREVEGQGVH